ncbi:MAG: hypothetical protein ACOCZ6_05805 [Nanoarchaeota archaeon]
MELASRVLQLKEYNITYLQENIETVIYSLLCFLVPFLISHPQYLVGTLVNAALILGALNVRTYRLLPIIMMPSIGVLAAGIIFGPFTNHLVYMIPFIWIGNFIIVYAFKYMFLSKKINKWTTLLSSAILKAGFLFAIAAVLVSLNILPVPFLIGMGPVQLLTAITGGLVAFLAQYTKMRIQSQMPLK